jgi:hypothetical protein
MYENYTRQALPSKQYRELLGSAICVFNSNNQFIIENILRINNNEFNWHDLIDKTSGQLSTPIQKTITEKSDEEISDLFTQLTIKRNRIVHSFQITFEDEQILSTKDRQHNQFHITIEYLLQFIKENEVLCDKLYKLRGF